MTGASGAIFSPCRQYRYVLWRTWDASKPTVNFVGLNPSTADELTDDPTMRRCRGFAVEWGYGGFVMTNLFAFRATKPRDLKAAPEPIGPENDKWLVRATVEAEAVVVAWGSQGRFAGRDAVVLGLLGSRGQCIGRTKHGHPKHPLYLKGGLSLQPFTHSER